MKQIHIGKAKVSQATFQNWLNALRSGKYQQTAYHLQDENGFCCLGVGCAISIPEKDKEKLDEGMLAGYLPEDQREAPEWLKNINKHFHTKTGEDLTGLNDSGNYSFEEIADLLEAVYILKVLN